MIDVAPWASRLQDLPDTPFAMIEGLAGLGRDLASDANPSRLPAAYVYTTGDQARDNVSDTSVTQRVDVVINITMAIPMRNRRHAEKTDKVLALRRIVRDAWLGWSPAEDFDTAVYVGGNLDTFDNGVAWWTDRYQTAYLMRI